VEVMDYLAEQVRTIKNLCEVALILRELNRNELLPTILETIMLEAEDMVDEYCVEDK
jgi:hypothetical protein